MADETLITPASTPLESPDDQSPPAIVSPTLITPRALLPKPASSSSGKSNSSVLPPRIKSSQGPPVAIACDGCRSRKTKCDALKPVCSGCLARVQACTYRDPDNNQALKRKHDELQQSLRDLYRVLDMLRTAPEDMADAVFLSLRGATPLSEIVDTVQSGKLKALTPSTLRTARAVSVPTRSTVEFDLNARFPFAFPGLVPLEVHDIDLDLLGVGNLVTPSSSPTKRIRLGSVDKSLTTPFNLRLSVPVIAGSSPQSLSLTTTKRDYVDPRLEKVDFRRWTHVPITNQLAATAINFYLINEHPILGLFEVNLFVGDLVTGSKRFCSPLLVSSLLAWACGAYSQINMNAKPLSEAFFEEAKIRWEIEGNGRGVTSISAAIFMTITCFNWGKDKDGLFYLDAAANIGFDLNLFGKDPSKLPSPPYIGDEDEQLAAAFASWGAFGWHTLHSMYFRRSHGIRGVPLLPIPGDAPHQGTHKSCISPLFMGSTFTWTCKFWLVVHDTIIAAAADASPDSPEFAEKAYQRLLVWSENLPSAVQRTDTCPHHVLIMHIWYHTAVMDIWRPFLTQHLPAQAQVLKSTENWPVALYSASVRQLKRLLYMYRKRFETTNRTLLVSPGFLYLLNEIFGDSASQEAQFYFLLSIRGYLSLASWSPAMCGVAKAFYNLGSRLGVMPQLSAGGLLEEIQAASAIVLMDTADYRSFYPVDLEATGDSIEQGNMETLAKGFQKLDVRHDRTSSEARRIAQPSGIWKGDQRDLNISLVQATRDEKEWEGNLPGDQV